MEGTLKEIINKNNTELKLMIKEIFSMISLLTEDKEIRDRIDSNIKKKFGD